MAVLGNQDILKDRKVLEQSNILKRTSIPRRVILSGVLTTCFIRGLVGAVVYLFHLSTWKVLSDDHILKNHPSIRGLISSCYHVKSSSFSCSVGSYKSSNSIFLDFNREIINRNNAPQTA